MSGKFYYPAAHFARSIKCIERIFTGTIFDNDDVTAADYERLTLIVNNAHLDVYFTPAQRREVWRAVHELLRTLEWEKHNII